jgi:hypothetical protein
VNELAAITALKAALYARLAVTPKVPGDLRELCAGTKVPEGTIAVMKTAPDLPTSAALNLVLVVTENLLKSPNRFVVAKNGGILFRGMFFATSGLRSSGPLAVAFSVNNGVVC